jgi:tetratricopeptide (TPR) repeat protein
MKLVQNSPTRALILIMIALVTIGILIARTYYRHQDAAVDPRIKEARVLYSRYNDYASSGDYYRVIALLDSIESIYLSSSDYSHAYEMGVLYNNRGAVQLTIALYSDSIDKAFNPYYDFPEDSLINMAESNINYAIGIYNNWIYLYKGLDKDQIKFLIKPGIEAGTDLFYRDMIPDIIDARAKEIYKSIAESGRRLSVCYTNLGVIYRQRGEFEKAIRQYEKALELWDRNLDAENNINRLLGQPIKKRNIIQKLFPPDRDD